MYNTCFCICDMLYITWLFYMNISCMLIYVVHLTYIYECFLMKYNNKYFHPFSKMGLFILDSL
jgi:hypothetical protein